MRAMFSAVLAVSLSLTAAAAPPSYSLVGSFAGPGPTFAVAPDGRIYGLAGDSILRQNAVNTPTYSEVARLPAGALSPFGASFMRFSPDGHTLAIGDGKFDASASVLVLDADPLNTSVTSATPATITATVTSPNFDAAWDSASRLYITGARSSDFTPIVNRIDLGGPSPVVGTVISNIGIASGGIALRGGRLYTGCGFLPTGEIRSFDLASLSTVAPAPFTAGTLIGSFLSASPLGFDNLGNLLVGGGDAFSGTSDTGYAAVVDLADIGHPLRLSPVGPTALYSPVFNNATGELLVFDSLNFSFHRYIVPAPWSGLLMAAGVIAAGRRRR